MIEILVPVMLVALLIAVLAVLFILLRGQKGGRQEESNLFFAQKQAWDLQDKRLAELTQTLNESQNTLQKSVSESQRQLAERLTSFSLQNETQLENIRSAVSKSISTMQEENLSAQKQAWDLQDKRLAELTQTLNESQNTLQKSVSESQRQLAERLTSFSLQNETQLENIRSTVSKSISTMQEENLSAQKQAWDVQDKRLAELTQTLNESQNTLQKSVSESQRQLAERLTSFSLQNETQLENIRSTVSKSLAAMQEDNNKKLEEMRRTVDEKLQKTLEERIGQSFKMVSDQLEQVYKGLGEMQTLAVGVGDLKRVMSGVKTRGIWGEYQLGAILEQILTPDQYVANVATKKNSREVVEYAVIFPGNGEEQVYLPIDAKFPVDTFDELVKASEEGDTKRLAAAQKALEIRIKSEARDIRDKYIQPPYTTDFAVLFLPTEALYAEVVKLGLLEMLQRDYKINIAGPTTMGAFLNSLQMGFKTLAVQKRSAEVWAVLSSVKNEFEKFGAVIEKARQRMKQTDEELETLVGVRTRMISSKLRSIESGVSQELEEGDGATSDKIG